MAKVYLPPEAHRWIRLIAASENISRSSVMMRIITQYFVGIQDTDVLRAFKALPEEIPRIRPPRRRPSPPTSKTRIGQQTAPKAQPVSLSKLAAEDEKEA